MGENELDRAMTLWTRLGRLQVRAPVRPYSTQWKLLLFPGSRQLPPNVDNRDLLGVLVTYVSLL